LPGRAEIRPASRCLSAPRRAALASQRRVLAVGELLPTLPLGSPITAYLPSIAADCPDRRQQCRVAVASTLLASLELARNGALTLEQPGASMPVEVY
jgi:chromatin segregation and condensation protein Rec8/ScpA/Scc1 (kleisin family)